MKPAPGAEPMPKEGDTALRDEVVVPGDGADPLLGAWLGGYQVEEEVARGGMSVVYRAVRADDVFHKRVAVKVVKRGLDTGEVLRRFAAERRILAALDHPGIAKLLDGGTTPDGRPYFVLDYVDGLRIDRYVERHALGLKPRLRLFLEVCAAVQHAHRALVVHRDLKPGNILVTADGTPKLLDFGIAKLLDADPDPDSTATSGRAMTPAYASPEQVRGESVTTATDAYSLGVVLYELLTGQRPYRVEAARTPEEVARLICEVQARRPSEAAPGKRALRGELDNIVLMALRKEPARRYGSAEQLATDVRRYLEGRAVSAHPDSFGYRARTFVRRNRVAVSVAAALAATSLAGMAAIAWQARVARAERARAEGRFNDVRQLANSFLFDFHDAITDLPGSTPAREMVVKRGLEYLDGLAREAGGDPELRLKLARAYRRLGDIQGGMEQASRAESKAAMASYQRALGLLTAGAVPRAGRRDLADLHLLIGRILASRHGEQAAGLGHMAWALAVYEELEREGEPAGMRGMIAAHSEMGLTQTESGEIPPALAHQREAVRLAEADAARAGATAQDREVLANAQLALGRSLSAAGQGPEAIDVLGRSCEARRAQLAGDAQSGRARRALAVCTLRLGQAQKKVGLLAEAVSSFAEAHEAFRDLAAEDPADLEARRFYAVTAMRQCEVLLDSPRPKAADGPCQVPLRVATELWTRDKVPYNAWGVFFGHILVGRLKDAQGDARGAAEHFRIGMQWSENLGYARTPANLMHDLALARSVVGAFYMHQGWLEPAERELRAALAVREEAVARAPLEFDYGLALADSYIQLANLHALRSQRQAGRARAGPAAESCAFFVKAQQQLERLRSRQPLPHQYTQEFERVTAARAACP